MTSFITQCPHCSTSFRVSSTQLTAARGMVRCGACLEVFNAAHALSQDPQSGQPQQSPLAEAPTQPPAPAAAAPSAGPDRAAQDDSQWIHERFAWKAKPLGVDIEPPPLWGTYGSEEFVTAWGRELGIAQSRVMRLQPEIVCMAAVEPAKLRAAAKHVHGGSR